MKYLTSVLATFVLMAATSANAAIVRKEAEGSVAQVMEDLSQAVRNAGATVFAEVSHSDGAASVNMELNDAALLIFGNPALGTPALQDDIHAGLFLPLRVMVYADDAGQTWIAYEEIEAMFNGLDIDSDAPYLEKMEGAIERFIDTARN